MLLDAEDSFGQIGGILLQYKEQEDQFCLCKSGV